jgi:hypothetical protein
MDTDETYKGAVGVEEPPDHGVPWGYIGDRRITDYGC